MQIIEPHEYLSLHTESNGMGGCGGKGFSVPCLFCGYSLKVYGKRKELFDIMHVKAKVFEGIVG